MEEDDGKREYEEVEVKGGVVYVGKEGLGNVEVKY